MPDDLYDRDVLTWSERQADLLRRLAAGERLNEAVDWPNVIEEIESVGRFELQRCESFLLRSLRQLLKLSAWPDSLAVRHWNAETRSFRRQARKNYTRSMRQRLDLPDIYADALCEIESAYDESGAPLSLPPACRLRLDDLVAPRPDVGDLLAKLRDAGGI